MTIQRLTIQAVKFALLPLILAAPGFCDDASKNAKVEEFMHLAKLDRNLANSMNLAEKQIKSGLMQQVTGIAAPPDAQKYLDELQEKLTAILEDALSWEKIKPEYAKILADAYTEAQLDDLIAFYKSPTGQAMVEKTPEVMAKGSELGQQRIIEHKDQIQRLMADYMSKLRGQPKR